MGSWCPQCEGTTKDTTSLFQSRAFAEDGQLAQRASASLNVTNMAQTKSPNHQGKKKQSTQEFTKEKTTPLLPTKSTSKLPCRHRLNGKKAKTTGTTPPCNMDEDKLDLTQVNMDIGVEVRSQTPICLTLNISDTW